MKKQASFATNEADAALIHAIMERCVGNVPGEPGFIPKRQRLDYEMSLTACHVNGCTLRLQDMLAAPLFDLQHDIFGIDKHIDKESGEILRCFSPRYHA